MRPGGGWCEIHVALGFNSNCVSPECLISQFFFLISTSINLWSLPDWLCHPAKFILCCSWWWCGAYPMSAGEMRVALFTCGHTFLYAVMTLHWSGYVASLIRCSTKSKQRCTIVCWVVSWDTTLDIYVNAIVDWLTCIDFGVPWRTSVPDWLCHPAKFLVPVTWLSILTRELIHNIF